MSNIRIDPDTMNARAGEYRQEADQVGQVITKMNNLLATLQTEWEGEASRSYATRYETDLRPSFQRAQDLINEIAVALDNTAAQMRERDAFLAASFR